MSSEIKEILFPLRNAPENIELVKVSENIFWARMPLPHPLDHVNVYIIEDSFGLTIIDTGVNTEETRLRWDGLLRRYFKGKRLERVIITHHHPDHIGLAGWFHRKYDAEIYSSRTSYLMARMLTLDVQEKMSSEATLFYIRAGMPKDVLQQRKKIRPMNFSDSVYDIPLGFKRLVEGEEINFAGHGWKIIFGHGHAPSHATFWSNRDSIVFVGDQVLPGISPNLGVYPTEPEADTVGEWISSCRKLLRVSDNKKLVLPGHKLPFTGLSIRLEQLIQNHKSVLKRIGRRLNKGPSNTVGLFKTIFKREIRKEEYGLALSEAVGHMNHLHKVGKVSRKLNADGAYLWSKI